MHKNLYALRIAISMLVLALLLTSLTMVAAVTPPPPTVGWAAPFQLDSGVREVPAAAVTAAGTNFAPVAPLAASPAPTSSFLALGDSGNSIPPDTHGAAGPNHLMTTLNTQVRIQNRSGTTLTTTNLNSWWSDRIATGEQVFDPKIFYDPYGDRWIFVSCVAPGGANSGFLLAASKTNDPTGAWWKYRFAVDPSNLLWFDYPSLGFNKNWVVLNGNLFTKGDVFDHSSVFVFTKSALYSGGTLTPRIFPRPTGEGGTFVPAETYDNTVSTLYLLQDYNGSSGGRGYLKLRSVTGAVGSESLIDVGYVSTPNPWTSFLADGSDFAPQLGSNHKIQNNDSRIQNVVYRNGSLWTTQTVYLPDGAITRSAVQWWEINPGASGVNQFGRIDDSTGATFYAFPSIAVNNNNDLLIGYSRYSGSQYASANYSYRDHSDPANTLRADTVLKAGEAPYYKTFSGMSNRWGDYSHTMVDPANDTDFWTIQEFAAAPSGGADRWGTWWGKIVPPVSTFTISGKVVLNGANTGLAGVQVNDGAGHIATTIADGTYTINSVPAGSFTITPSLAEYTFSPASTAVIVGPSKTDINFAATVVTYSISGKVTIGTSAGPGLAGVTMDAGGGHITTTIADGTYTINGVPAGNFTITPSLAEYTFSPVSMAVTVGPSKIDINFAATVVTYTVSGRVTLNGNGMAGVTVTDAAGHTTTTSVTGDYTLSGLSKGTYFITPILRHYGFMPAASPVVVDTSKTGINFTGILLSNDVFLPLMRK